MKHLFLITFLVGIGLPLSAQLALNVSQVSTPKVVVSHTAKKKTATAVELTPVEPASKDLLQQLYQKGLLPLYIEPFQGLITCSWSDGVGGAIECPSSAVTCGVFGNSTTLYIACVDKNNLMVGELQLDRPRY